MASTRELRERNPPPPLSISPEDPPEEEEEEEGEDSWSRKTVVGPSVTYLKAGGAAGVSGATNVAVVAKDSIFGATAVVGDVSKRVPSFSVIVCGRLGVSAANLDVFNSEGFEEEEEEVETVRDDGIVVTLAPTGTVNNALPDSADISSIATRSLPAPFSELRYVMSFDEGVTRSSSASLTSKGISLSPSAPEDAIIKVGGGF